MKLSTTNPQLATMQVGDTLIDYAVAPPTDVIRRYPAVIRYLKPSMSHPYALRASEVEWLHGSGIGVHPVCEGGATDALQGWGKGMSDGLLYSDHANTLGIPPEIAIPCSFDFDVWSANLNVCLLYWEGFQNGCSLSHRVAGSYGDSDIITRTRPPFAIQTANAWSHGVSPWATCLQHVGQDHRFDTDVVLKEFPVWVATHTTVPPQPQNNLIIRGEDMFHNVEAFVFGGITYGGALNGSYVYWRFNDQGVPVHITTTQEVMSRGGHALSQAFTNAQLAGIPGLPTS